MEHSPLDLMDLVHLLQAVSSTKMLPVVRVPWTEGLTLAAASQTAKMSVAQRAVDVVRAGKIVYAATRPAGDGAALASGDVVRLGN